LVPSRDQRLRETTKQLQAKSALLQEKVSEQMMLTPQTPIDSPMLSSTSGSPPSTPAKVKTPADLLGSPPSAPAKGKTPANPLQRSESPAARVDCGPLSFSFKSAINTESVYAVKVQTLNDSTSTTEPPESPPQQPGSTRFAWQATAKADPPPKQLFPAKESEMDRDLAQLRSLRDEAKVMTVQAAEDKAAVAKAEAAGKAAAAKKAAEEKAAAQKAAPPKSTKKGAAALLKSLRTGELEKVVDDMEAQPPTATPAKAEVAARSPAPPSSAKDLKAPLLSSEAATKPKAISKTPRSEATASCFIKLGRLCSLVLILISVASSALAFSAYTPIQLIQKRLVGGWIGQIDYSLRLTIDPSYCIAATDSSSPFEVRLRKCQYLSTDQKRLELMEDGTIRLKADMSFCLSVVSSGEITFGKCSGIPEQLWVFRPGGRFQLQNSGSDQLLCMNVLGNDLPLGKLGLYGCELDSNEVFAYGGGHFLVPELLRDLDFTFEHLETLVVDWQIWKIMWRACIVASCFVLLKVFCSWDKGSKNFAKLLDVVAVLCICMVLQSESESLGKLKPATAEFKQGQDLSSLTGLDYSFRMSTHPLKCITTQSETPSAHLTMEECTGNRSQQFLFKNADGKQTIHLKSKPELCVGIDDTGVAGARAVLNRACQPFAASFGSGGGLQLAGTSLCINLWNGDAKAGKLGYFECAHDINEVFVYSQGNPTVARLLHHLHGISEWITNSGVTLSFQLSRMAMIFLGACFPALWLVRPDSWCKVKKADFLGSSDPPEHYIGA
jgi:hypothetical protein